MSTEGRGGCFLKSKRHFMVREFFLGLCLVLVALAGCAPPTAKNGHEGPTVAHQPVATASAPARFFAEPPADDLDGGKLVEETWDLHLVQGKRVGYARTTIANVEEIGRALVRTSTFLRTEMQRGGQATRQDLKITSWDTPAGELVRFESVMAQGGGEIVSVGAVQDGQLGIDTTTLGRTQSQKIPWQADWGGVFAPDQSLRAKPLKPGEKRTVRSLLPMFNVLGETQFAAGDYETVVLPVGPVKLLKVDCAMVIGGQRIESVQWLDAEGRALKLFVPGVGQESVRTTKADALRAETGEQYDLLLASIVPTQGRLAEPAATKEVRYEARMKSGSIEGLFADCLSQRVRRTGEQTAEIIVRAIRPDMPAVAANGAEAPPVTKEPTPEDLAANNFIQTDDREVALLAGRVAPDETDAWRLACALESYVDETIQTKNYSQSFATAAEVARSLEGDCTEHSLLFAALCRQRKIPARVAFGFVYFPQARGFAGHMWNEVWVRDRWIPMDSTLGQGGIGAERIKLGDSNLSGGSPLVEMLSVIQVIGRLELKILSAE